MNEIENHEADAAFADGYVAPASSHTNTYLAIATAGVIGLAIGTLLYRRNRSANNYTLDRAVELARSGSVRTVSSLKRRLREEGLSPAQIEGRAKRYLGDLLQTAANRLR